MSLLDRPIAVLGGGNGAHCMAADLTLGGHEVNLYEHPRFAERFAATMEAGAIELEGIGRRGTAKLRRVTLGMADAVADAGLINVVIPASGHELFFGELIPHLRDDHTVVLWAGDFGSLRLRQLLSELPVAPRPTIYETHTLPYGARLSGPARVHLFLTAPRVLISALPATSTGTALASLRELFPCLEPWRNVLVTALNNPNPLVHPPGSLLNVGRIQYSGGDFNLYREGMTEAVTRVIRVVFEEAKSVADALGGGMLEYEDRDFRTTASIMGVAFQAPFDTLGVIASVKGPHTIHDRYITEDLPFGLVPIIELGEALGVATPVIEVMVTLGGVVCEEDFRRTGRTLATLGLAGLGREEIIETVTGDVTSGAAWRDGRGEVAGAVEAELNRAAGA